MTQDKNKNDRILGIYDRLRNGCVVHKAEEAKRYGVNERSIQRDLDDIRNYLMNQSVYDGSASEIRYDRLVNGYRLEDGSPMKFTNSEALAICKILLESRAFVTEELMPMLDKFLEGCVLKDNVRYLKELIANEKYHYIEPIHRTRVLDRLWEIGVAVKESRILELDYQRVKGKEIVHRRLQPAAILFSEYYFYLAAYITDTEKELTFEVSEDPYPTIYRIDRIKSLTVTGEHFKIPYKDRFEEGEFRKRIQFMYGGKLQKIKFEFRGEPIEAVLDRIPTARIMKEEAGVYTVTAEVFGKGIDMWIRSQGEKVTLLKE